MTEPEIVAFIKQAKEEAFLEGYLKAVDTMAQETAKEMSELEAECKAYKDELIETLRKASMCQEQYNNPDMCCSECVYFFIDANCCPSACSTYAAKLRLEELTGGGTIC